MIEFFGVVVRGKECFLCVFCPLRGACFWSARKGVHGPSREHDALD